jgi:transcriptional regulator with XRE-family HTH domain
MERRKVAKKQASKRGRGNPGGFEEGQRRQTQPLEGGPEAVAKMVRASREAMNWSARQAAKYIGTRTDGRAFDVTLSRIEKKQNVQIPNLETLKKIALLLPDPDNSDRPISPGDLYLIYTGEKQIDPAWLDSEEYAQAVQKITASPDLEPAFEYRVLGKLLDTELKERGVTLEAFASTVGLPASVLSSIIAGTYDKPPKRVAAVLANFIVNPDTDELFVTGESLLSYCTR